jgi:uncharacterized lipoprotein YmbA
MTPRLRPALAWPAIVGCLALGACGHSPPTRFFTLDLVAPAATTAGAGYGGAPVIVHAVHIPPALDRMEMVNETSPGAVQINDFAHWAAPLGQSARQALIQDLASRLPAGKVVYPDAPLPSAVIGLTVDVLSFNATAGGASLQASLTFSSATPNRSWRTRQVDLKLDGDYHTPEATARALSALMGQVSDAAVDELVSPPPQG